MDAATMRRGAESANSRWDNTVAILTGDFLFAHASRLVADLGPDAVRIIAETFAELVTGQMRETRGPRAGEDPVQHYLTVIAEKTGSLIATAGRYGGMFSGCPPEQVESLRRFGASIGTAFQISDDVIDIASPSDSSGKTPAPTCARACTPADAVRAAGRGPRRRPAAGAARPPDHRRRRGGRGAGAPAGGSGLARARDVLADQAAAARAELGKLPACPASDALAALTVYVIDRNRLGAPPSGGQHHHRHRRGPDQLARPRPQEHARDRPVADDPTARSSSRCQSMLDTDSTQPVPVPMTHGSSRR
jgi:heptaprenyl diphosphate synthase